ncbi:gluconate:H+ symporter [Gephyromycinifex aptenodytis]|uniref:gluconate:H+ symporter n=1 Tax=Gephyromycinifex aptenodytis TaxID=2716227 RepID=UPI0014449F3C|nr:gluconate:H+ symporter [Gephyromycinifex aptenodytis]
MPLLVVAIAVAVLLVLMTRFKFNGFISLLLVAIGVALVMGIAPDEISDTLAKGLGGQIKDTMLVVGLGAMLGRVLGDSGAAQRIASKLVDVFGVKGVQAAMVISAMLLGVTMFYEAAFVIIVPVAFTLVRATKTNLLWVGLPMSIALSTMHSFLPPHPGPTAVAGTFNASVGLTLAYGLLFAVPIAAFIAMLWPRLPFIKKMNPSIPTGLVSEKLFTDEEMPSMRSSLVITLLPVVLIAGAAVADMTMDKNSTALSWINFFGAAPISLMIALMVATYVLGPRIGRSLEQVAASCTGSAKAMAMILMTIGAGGAFKQVLVEAGIADYIKDITGGLDVSPIILAWVIAAVLRIALGSATVAVVTAAGVAAPIAAVSGVQPELMVLAVSCGSIAFSHVNDPGFWMFKEYFNLSVMDAIKARTTYTTCLAVLGLLGVLSLNAILGPV